MTSTLTVNADQMEVASALSPQGSEILQSDVTILQGHTSEVWVSMEVCGCVCAPPLIS